MRKTGAVSAVLLIALVAGCGGGTSPDKKAAGSGSPSVASPSTSTGSPVAPSDNLNAVKVTGGTTTKPFALDFASPLAVDQTMTKVLDPGSGPKVQENTTLLMDYVAVNATTGQPFDNSWSRGGAQTFPLVPDQTLPGFLSGLVGQRVGSDLLVAIPPSDAWPQGNPQAGIGPTDTLLFAFHLQAASDPHPLPMAQGPSTELPKDVPQLQTNDQGQPTGFQAPAGKPLPDPTELGIYPVIKGSGATVHSGDLVTVQYVGQLYPDGKVFDESWSRGKPVSFQIGSGGLIKAWDEGLIGQRVGSRLVLVVPPDYGYGAKGAPPNIPGGASLIFAVDILGVG